MDVIWEAFLFGVLVGLVAGLLLALVIVGLQIRKVIRLFAPIAGLMGAVPVMQWPSSPRPPADIGS